MKKHSVSIPSYWSDNGVEIVENLNEILEFTKEKAIDLQVKEVEKSGRLKETSFTEKPSAAFDSFKMKIFGKSKRIKCNEIEDIISRISVTYNKIIDIVVVKYIHATSFDYALPPGLDELKAHDLLLQSFNPREVKVHSIV